MINQELKEQIRGYYEYCEADYRNFWDLDCSLAMHLGYWDETTVTLSDALSKENEIIAEVAQVKRVDKVLDAGCGVGGTALFLAQKYGCTVEGITICEHQVVEATKNGLMRKIDPLPQFKNMDFTETDYNDESFDVVLGIESVCYAEEKMDFIREAYRILKKGGRLTIADGFLMSKKNSVQETEILKAYADGWVVPHWDIALHFEEKLRDMGFHKIYYRNITEHIAPSLKLLYHFYEGSELSSPSEEVNCEIKISN